MGRASSKRKANVNDAISSPEPSKKRVKTLRASKKNAPHPFSELPHELQLRILSFCDKKSLAAMSMVSQHWREMSLLVIWETQPVGAIMKNFTQLDKHEDLRLAIRHLKVSTDCAPNATRMRTVASRLAARLPKNRFPGLREFTIDYHKSSTDPYIQIINLLAAHKPKNLKSLNINTIVKWTRSGITMDPEQKNIVYPTGLTTIRISCGYWNHQVEWDPLLAFDANKDTLTTAKLDVRGFLDHFSLKPCPNVRSLTIRQDYHDQKMAERTPIKFPNVEELFLDAPQFGGMLPHNSKERILVSKGLE
ncbi:hypothetical protein TWF694_007261 [Orbilia ellipsospora]|uniref:F-box domain-containing protein n=1 Tax=Orbilia ellipsospora TaxID=2528407 RepID=A0AAV9XIN6_9PEZI